jgi:hypothetical protein
MIRIIGPKAPSAASQARPVIDLHPFVEYQCCAAISHLQQAVQIPNSQVADVVGFPKREYHAACKRCFSAIFESGTGLAL